MNECSCGTQTLDHAFDCPAYVPYYVNEPVARQLEIERYEASKSITTEKLRRRVLAATNGHGGRPSINRY